MSFPGPLYIIILHYLIKSSYLVDYYSLENAAILTEVPSAKSDLKTVKISHISVSALFIITVIISFLCIFFPV